MASDQRIIIELKNVGGGNDGAETNRVADNNSDLQKTLKTLLHPVKTLEQNTIGKNVIVNQAYMQAKQIVKEVGQYHIYKYFTLKEDYLSETAYNNALSGIGKVTSFGTTIAAGAIAGAALGPVGAIVGGAVGGIGWGITQYIDNKGKMLQQQVQINTNNAQSQFQQTRLGLTEGRGVTNQ